MEKIAKYELREVIGHGGMGIVYRAYDTIMDRDVAIKVIQEKALLSPELKARFIQEARMAGKLSHENVTTIHDLGETDGKTFIVMEYLSGIDLRTIIDRKEPLPLRKKLDYVSQILRGLHYAHENGIVHRDIKPENVKIQPDGRVKIMDFGIAKPVLPSATPAMAESGPVLTSASMRIGTPWYMSPEQIQGLPVDRRSDIFSFGVLLYELLTYTRPFDGDDTTVLYRIMHTEPEPLHLEDSVLRADLQRILSRCIVKNPDDRYRDCGEVLRDLLAVPGTESALHAVQGPLQIPEAQVKSVLAGMLPSTLEGTTISHFRILEKIGTGGMGVVHKAEDLTLRRTVALKFLLSEGMLTDEAKRRFLKEAQAASALDHPNICTIHEVGETPGGLLFICMTYYQGDNLGNVIRERLLGIPEALSIGLRVARGLAKAHEHGIVHRDIKPANIILTSGGEVKIVDFGLAKLAGTTRITRIGSALGTLPYMSPEQVRGEELDKRTDVWSLGVLLYHILTGKLPFEGAYEAAVFFAVLNVQPPPPSQLRAELPPAIDGILAKALQKKAEDRYADMHAFLADLEPLAREDSSATRSATTERSTEVIRLLESGKAYLGRTEYDEALSRFEAALSLAPGHPEARSLREQCVQKLADQKQAKALAAEGRLMMERGRVEEARDILTAALALDAGLSEASALLAQAEEVITRNERIEKLLLDAEFLLRRRKFDEASESYRKALELDPSRKEALTGLRRVDRERGRKIREDLKRTPLPRRIRHRRFVLPAAFAAGLFIAAGLILYLLRSEEGDRRATVSQTTSPGSVPQQHPSSEQGTAVQEKPLPEAPTGLAKGPEETARAAGKRSPQRVSSEGKSGREAGAVHTRSSSDGVGQPGGPGAPGGGATSAGKGQGKGEIPASGGAEPGAPLTAVVPPAPATRNPQPDTAPAGRNEKSEGGKPEAGKQGGASVVPPAAETHATESAIRGMLTTYKQSIEQGDVQGLAALLGLSSDHTAPWSDFFSVSENRTVSIGEPNIDISGDSARVSFIARISYFNNTTNQPDSRQNVRVWTLAARNGGWRIVTQK